MKSTISIIKTDSTTYYLKSPTPIYFKMFKKYGYVSYKCTLGKNIAIGYGRTKQIAFNEMKNEFNSTYYRYILWPLSMNHKIFNILRLVK
jgi:hypothetical protein